MKGTTNRKITLLVLMVLGLLALGTLGYILLEGWGPVDALFMTVITLTTVGFSEVNPLSTAGRLFTIGLILLGVGTLAYGLRTLGELVLERDYLRQWRKRRIMRQVDLMRDHVIVCGYGRVGESVVVTLLEGKRPFVLIEKEPSRVGLLVEQGFNVIEGDATNDTVLRRAGVERAWGMIVCAGEDSVNLFIVLSARAINAGLYIIARSVDGGNEAKMRLAGANRVISPYQIGGRHMANIAIRPHVVDFFEVATLDTGEEVWVEEVVVENGSYLEGKTVGDADVRRQTGVTLIALRHTVNSGQTSTLIPDANTRLMVGDELIVVGTREQLLNLESLAR
ncbi:MAG: potassium channel protein [Ardenticatenaceae bacterium]|nr:potassium channel protein [Ardenticatenaceae bacterium]